MSKRLCMGIDEAGRGCVLGPMVIAGVVFEEKKELFDTLYGFGVKDSKLLSPSRRAELFRVIRKHKHRFRTVSIGPSRIDRQSLNTLEIIYSARFVRELLPDIVYIDVPASGRGIHRYVAALRERIAAPSSATLIGENHMDATNIVVAAASIIAKEIREKKVRELHRLYGDFGSGYPSDPKTQAWLASWHLSGQTWPSMVRTKWETVTRMSH